MTIPIRIGMTVTESQQNYGLRVIEKNIPISVDVETPIVAGVAKEYEGEYDITPTDTAQVFSTEGKRCPHNFIVEPIPNNYGLITYNGSIITVS